MFYSIRGKVIHKDPSFVAIDCGGVGFKLFTTLTTLSRIGGQGEEATLYTYLNVREGALDLFGFADQAELGCFQMMLSVSGVGPKVALGVLSSITPERFALAVAADDIKTIRQAPGIGPKLAQRIILELKDKVQKENVAQGFTEIPANLPTGVGNVSEAVSALMVLGYTHGEAAQVIAGLDPAMSVEDMIKHGLKMLASR